MNTFVDYLSTVESIANSQYLGCILKNFLVIVNARQYQLLNLFSDAFASFFVQNSGILYIRT